MRIAQVAPLIESVPPHLYGGTERVVSWLTEELVREGHDVTLFATGDSSTRARLVPCAERALRQDPSVTDPLAHHLNMIERVFSMGSHFDLIHFHTDYLHYPLSRRSGIPTVTTLHGRLDLPDLVPVYREFDDIPLVSISDAQRDPLPWANWMGTVYHGMPLDLFQFEDHPRGDHLLFLGRLSPEKRVDRAIEVAERVGMRLKIAAKVDRADRDYFESEVRHRLNTPGIEFLGEVGGARKAELLRHARALLFPVDWPEPFGLVMIEAMACGTPVIAWPCGSVPEVIRDGVSGCVVRGIDEAVRAVRHVGRIDRRRCRAEFEQRFSAPRMAQDYVAIYRRLIARHAEGLPPRARAGTHEWAEAPR
ncbi:MAG TPA: glycosyltransferase family 4 protein [Candidatus Eisenbacteria bacterium]|nr:glycosyltransferase family 4 protein [Candidatus Eisenbacteria bacterium]